MSLSRRGFLTALATAPAAAALPAPSFGPMPSAKAQQAAAFVGAALHHPAFDAPVRLQPVGYGRFVERLPIEAVEPHQERVALEAPKLSEPDMNLIDYLNSINGQPYDDERHCLALAAEIQRRFFGQKLPLPVAPRSPGERHVAIHTDPARARWVQVDGPAHGAIVLMSPRAESRIDCHIGVCLLVPEPVVAHTDRPQGVCVDDLMTLRARGWHETFWMPA